MIVVEVYRNAKDDILTDVLHHHTEVYPELLSKMRDMIKVDTDYMKSDAATIIRREYYSVKNSDDDKKLLMTLIKENNIIRYEGGI